jgi:hypothetical protein
MDKLIETLGKILESLLSSKTLWIIIVAVAILSFGLLAISGNEKLAAFFGINGLMGNPSSREVVGLAALVSLGLILARVVIWVVGRVREQYFT